jgi:exosortase
MHAWQMILVTFCLLYYAGGWPWMRHFAFPVLFVLVMVPWPVPLEQGFVQDLMRVIAAITVELVGLFNIPAVQHGNIIQISAGFVGIDEACSGVRSLQTALFICLFLGELYRFCWSKRSWLIFLGLLVALLANLGRTFYLVWVAFHHGMDRMHLVHDLAGQSVMVFTLVGIWLVSQILRRKHVFVSASSNASAVRGLPIRLAIYVLAWFLLAEVLTQSWYRLHESNAQPNARWSVVWPESGAQSKTIRIDETVRSILRYNEGREGIWQDEAGYSWQAFFFRWAPARNSAQLASAHTPDICLRGAGYKLTRDVGTELVAVAGLNLPFHQYVFERAGSPLHVFYCRWEDQKGTHFDTSYDNGSKLSRILAVLAGRRNLGQQVLEAIVSGPETPAEGLASLEQQLPQMIRR